MGNKLAIPDLISMAIGLFVENDSTEISKMTEKLSSLSEEEFRTTYINGNLNKTDLEANSKTNLFKRLIKSLLRKNEEADTFIKKRLAVGIAAFSRCPADLKNTELYPTQVKAAIALTSSCVLQMDTGEGKTYAVLPAAYALAGRYGRVYVICANSYLAYRDAKRTKPYWDYVGLNVQYIESCDNNCSERWKGEIIYTTLNVVMVKALKDDLNGCPADRRILYSAVIIDEIDAVLLDDYGGCSVISNIQAEAYDWKNAIEFAKKLDADKEVVVDATELSAALTIEGENKLKEYISGHNLPLSVLGQFREAVEYSYIALTVKENQDYVIKDGMIYSINRSSGEWERGISKGWMIPLEILKNLKPRSHSVTLHSISAELFMRQFRFVSGMSGTTQEDAAEYLFGYKLPTVVIKPRIKRINGEIPDKVFTTRKGAIISLCEEIQKEAYNGRPVLVGTQSINDAREIYDLLMMMLKEDDEQELYRIHLITGQEGEDVAHIYEHGGEDDSIIIATQISGRGVDIRLSQRSKENGGLALFGFEHSMDKRHDRQFLGRAGRQGEPYTSQFFLSAEGQLLRMGKAKEIFEAMEIEELQPIQHKQLNNAIRNLQNEIREHEFYRRRAKSFLIEPDEVMYCSIRDWLQNLNSGDNRQKLPFNFMNYLVNHFINANLSHMIKDNMNYEQSKDLICLIKHIFADIEENEFSSIVLDGKRKEFVKNIIRDFFVNIISEREEESEKQLINIVRLYNFLSVYKCSCFLAKIHRIKRLLYAGTREETNNETVNLRYEELITKVAWIYKDHLMTSGDLKHLYLLLTFLEKNIALISRNKIREAAILLNIVSQKSFWINRRDRLGRYIVRHAHRNNYDIAYWTIINAGMRYRDYRNRVTHIYNHQELQPLERTRIISDSVMNEWAQIESTLSTEIIKNLISDRAVLDDLFVYQDKRVRSGDRIRGGQSLYQHSWDKDVNPAMQKNIEESTNWNEQLVKDFIMQSNTSLQFGISFNLKSLEALLNEFLKHCPVNTLQSPERIVTALENWKKQEVLLGYAQERVKINHKWILKFLKYLNERSIISALPSFQYYLRSNMRKIIHNIKDYNTLQAIVGFFSFWLFFVLFSKLGKWTPLPDTAFMGFVLADNLLCAGFISKGIITAPLLPLSRALSDMGKLIRFTISILFVFIYMNVLSPIPNFLYFLLRIPLCLGMAYLYYMFVNQYRRLHMTVDVPMFSIWIAFSVSSAFLPEIMEYGMRPLVVFGLIVLYYVLLHVRINKEYVTLLSTQIMGVTVKFESTSYKTQRVIEGNVRSLPHIYSFIGSFLLFLCLKNVPAPFNRITYYIFGLVYIIIFLILSVEIIKKRLSPYAWEKKLNSQKLIMIDSSAQDIVEVNLLQTLKEIKRHLLKRELLLQIAVFLICGFALKDYQIKEGAYPLFLLILFAAFWFGEHMVKILTSLYQIFIYNGQIVTKTMDFEDIKEPNEEKTFMQKFLEFLNPFYSHKKAMNAILAILGILAALNEKFGLLNKLFDYFIKKGMVP
ncbi:MAG: hypothetical protein Q4D94_09605 [Bacillota bacterium]|nr:hypothetical protein [Bacillota bacterium]